jgi:hypothetical protein
MRSCATGRNYLRLEALSVTFLGLDDWAGKGGDEESWIAESGRCAGCSCIPAYRIVCDGEELGFICEEEVFC